MSAPAVATRQSKGRAQRAATARVQADIVRTELDVFEQTLQKHAGRQGSGRALASNTSEMENNEQQQQRAASARAGRRNTQLTDKAGESNTMLRSAILQSLSRTAAFDPHEQHSLLHESLRLQEAARWLLQCPRHTLHVLQQRVLCAAQDYVMTFASVPPYLKPYVALLNAHAAILSDNHGKVLTPTGRNENKNAVGMHTWRQSQKEHDNNEESDDEDDEGTALPIPPPAPLPFLTFLTDFILGDDIEDTQEEEGGDSNDNDTKMKTTTTAVVVGKSRSVLCTGRPQPVATLSSANLIYGLPTIERVLYTTQQQQPTSATQDTTKTGSNTGASKGGGQKKRTAAQSNISVNDGQGGNSVYVWMERHQDVMADLVQWGEFFSSFFDEAREGFCREPVSLMCAVLLACGLLAHCELNDSLAAQTRRTLHALRSEPSVTVTHFNTCDACRARQAAIEAESCERLRKEEKTRRAGKPTTTRSSTRLDVSLSASTRLFHGTAAVVLWIETFLVLYRNGGRTGPTGTAVITTTTSRSRAEEHAEDTMRAAEVYLVRDWIAQQAALDVLSFEAQAFDGELRLPLSCASDAPVRRLSFTRDGVVRAVAAVTAWADECVTSGRPLATSVLLGLLREHLPVTAYYMTYFLPLQVPYCE